MVVFASARQTLEALIRAHRPDLGVPVEQQALLTESVLSVATYREEGSVTSPNVFITADPDDIIRRLRGADPLVIGEGPVDAQTVRRAIKFCGPLTLRRDWAVFLHPEANRIRYGIFRSDPDPLGDPCFHRLRILKNHGKLLIGIQRTGEALIEIRAPAGAAIYFDSSGKAEHRDQPPFLIDAFTKSITRDVNPPRRNKYREFYEKIIEELFSGARGSLIAVLEAGHIPPDALNDGIFLPQFFDPGPLLEQYLRRRSPTSSRALSSHANLILSMLEMDGITMMDTTGKVIAFHVFVSEVNGNHQLHEQSGGARSRAFSNLKALIGKGIYAVLYKSQDGEAEFEVSRNSS